MKKIFIFSIFIMSLLIGCEKNTIYVESEEVKGEQKQEDLGKYEPPIGMIENYEVAEFDKFNSPASENGLKNTKIYVKGILNRVFNSNNSILGYISDNKDNKWLLIIDSKVKSDADDYKYLENNEVFITGIYDGYSNLHKMPAMTVNRIFDYKSGDVLNSKMFLKYDGKKDQDYQNINMKESTTENNDEGKDIKKEEIIYNIPSKDNFKSFLYTIFNKYYGNKEYVFSGNKDDWSIINIDLSDHVRSKFTGEFFENNNWVRCDIIIEFTDKSNKEYSVKLLEINKNQIIKNENNNELLLNNDIKEKETETENEKNKNSSFTNKIIQENRIRILRDDWVKSQFNSWDGSNYELNNLIIKSLNDEKSFKHIQTKYIDITSDDILNKVKSLLSNEGYNTSGVEKWDIVVQVEFSAKNMFNSTVKNYGIGIIKYNTKSVKLIDVRLDSIM